MRCMASSASASLVCAALSSTGASRAASGCACPTIARAAQKALGVAYGVMVTKVRGAASRSRILPGDVIVGVNQTPVSGVEEFNRIVAAQSHGTIGLLVRRAEADLYISLEVGDAAAAERDPGIGLEDASRGAGAPTPEESFKAGRPLTNKPLRT